MNAHTAVVCSLALTGCVSVEPTPYVAYRHLSDPAIEDDGYDLACAGIKLETRLIARGGLCKDLRGGQMIEASIEYDFK